MFFLLMVLDASQINRESTARCLKILWYVSDFLLIIYVEGGRTSYLLGREKEAKSLYDDYWLFTVIFEPRPDPISTELFLLENYLESRFSPT